MKKAPVCKLCVYCLGPTRMLCRQPGPVRYGTEQSLYSGGLDLEAWSQQAGRNSGPGLQTRRWDLVEEDAEDERERERKRGGGGERERHGDRQGSSARVRKERKRWGGGGRRLGSCRVREVEREGEDGGTKNCRGGVDIMWTLWGHFC